MKKIKKKQQFKQKSSSNEIHATFAFNWYIRVLHDVSVFRGNYNALPSNQSIHIQRQ